LKKRTKKLLFLWASGVSYTESDSQQSGVDPGGEAQQIAARFIATGGIAMSRTRTSTLALLGGFALAAAPVSAWAGTYNLLYSFQGGNDGANPMAGLLDVNGTMFGTTGGGGSAGSGTVFSLNPSTGAETVLYTFQGGSDGADPLASLIKLGGKLYGTSYFGGVNDGGTVFSVNPETGNEKVVYAFQNLGSGNNPQASLINVNGALLGTTVYGGDTKCGEAGGCGTVFSVDPKTSAETVVYGFQGGNDGIFPVAGLVNFAGTLYGTTLYGGGANNGGTAFSVNPDTGVETVVHSFQGGNDGLNVQAPLVKVGTKCLAQINLNHWNRL
jgi:uncharacterized repeat protein (TIGR03803 family)